MPVRTSLVAGLVALHAIAAPLGAQTPPVDAPPLTLAYVDGRVDLARDSRVTPAEVPDAIDVDDRLLATSGRAELVGDDGTLFHLDTGADLRIDAGVRPRLVRGRLVVHTTPAAGDVAIALPTGVLRLEARGVYDLRADDLDGDTIVAVVDGRATMASGDSEWPLGPDDELRLDPRDARPRWSRAARADEMLLWSRRRADRATLARAAATLPPATQPWATDLAQAGQWDTLAPYGAVWYPAVAPGWRPYTDGRWRMTRRGWTWIDRARWGWPVHHYGRWGFQPSRGWYWLPQRTWGPGWVSWVVGADHVGWAPLGWDARPVAPFPLGGQAMTEGRWASIWSIAPRRTFGARGTGRVPLTDPRTLPGPVLGGFVSQAVGPRGTAGPDDRFLARPDQWNPTPAWPRRAGPVSPVAPSTRPPARILDAPRRPDDDGVVMRRPGDAPASRPPDAGLAPFERPHDRVWTAPPPAEMSHPDPAPVELRRAPRPVGPPVRPAEGAAPSRPETPPATAPARTAPPSGGHAIARPTAPAPPAATPPASTPTTTAPVRPNRRRG